MEQAIPVEAEDLGKANEAIKPTLLADPLPDEQPVAEEKLADEQPQDEEFFRRKGFYEALRTGGQPSALTTSVEQHQFAMQERLNRTDTRYLLRRNGLDKLRAYWQSVLDEKRRLLKEYTDEMDAKYGTLAGLREKMQLSVDEISKIALEIGLEKDSLVIKRIRELKDEMNAIITLYQDAEDKQNEKFRTEFERNRPFYTSQLERLDALQDEIKEMYKDVRTRMQILRKAGINYSLSGVLVGIGCVCAFITGWFYSEWMKPTPTSALGNEGDLRFFIVHALARFSTQYSYTALVSGALGYFILIGLVSWGCFELQAWFGFIRKKRKNKKRKKAAAESDEEDEAAPQLLDLDISNSENLLKARFRANNWFSFWLRATPFLLFLFLTIAIVARFAYNTKTGDDPFQSIFDSYANQALGSLIAVLMAGLMVLYIAKVMEPRYLKKAVLEEPGKIWLSWEIVIALLTFPAMVIIMVISHATGIRGGFENLAGFVLSTISTGIILGYGYRYRGLQETAWILEDQMETNAATRFHMTTPYQVSYLRYKRFHINMLRIQQAAQQLMENRNIRADELSGGEGETVPLLEPPPPADPRVEAEKRLKKGYKAGVKWLGKFFKGVGKMFRRHTGSKKTSPDVTELHPLTEADEYYLPKLAAASKVAAREAGLIYDQVKAIEREKESQRRNEKVFRSLNDQATHAARQVYVLDIRETEWLKHHQRARQAVMDRARREIQLITEGFITGQWYLQQTPNSQPGQALIINPAP